MLTDRFMTIVERKHRVPKLPKRVFWVFVKNQKLSQRRGYSSPSPPSLPPELPPVLVPPVLVPPRTLAFMSGYGCFWQVGRQKKRDEICKAWKSLITLSAESDTHKI